jgi:hypothetical protein
MAKWYNTRASSGLSPGSQVRVHLEAIYFTISIIDKKICIWVFLYEKQDGDIIFSLKIKILTPMILVSFFFSHRALSKNLSRNGIKLKVIEFDDTDKQTDISRLILKD